MIFAFVFLSFLVSQYIPNLKTKNNTAHIVFQNVHFENNAEKYNQIFLENKIEFFAFAECGDSFYKKLQNSLPKNKNQFFGEAPFSFCISSNKDYRVVKALEFQNIIYSVEVVLTDLPNHHFIFVHLPPPISNEFWQFEQYAVGVFRNVVSENNHLGIKTTLVGDFNAIPHLKILSDLLGSGDDLQMVENLGFIIGSWPTFLPLLKIDHVISNAPNVKYEMGGGFGSDHLQVNVYHYRF